LSIFKLTTLIFLTALPALARISANVPVDYANYSLIDRLEAYGCAQPTYRALRPQGHADLREAMGLREGKDACEAPAWLLREREMLIRAQLQNDARVGLYVRNEDPLPLVGIDAAVQPTYPERQGRFDFYGPNLFGELTANAEAGDKVGLAASITPGWVGAFEDYGRLLGRFYLHEGYLKVGYERLELTYGRTALGLGSSPRGGLILGVAAKPLNLWKFAFRPSYTATLLSAFTVETWLATNDPTTGIEDSKLWGIAVGARPFPFFEVTLLELYQFGGVGAPALEGKDYLPMLFYSNDAALQAKRQRNMAIDLGIWGPDHFVKGYGQFLFDELRNADEVSYLAGIWFPKLGEVEARLEWVSTAGKAYQHPVWTQGFTYQGTTLGHPLGADADGVYLDVGFPLDESSRLALSSWYERRGRSLASPLAPEDRYGAGAGWTGRWTQTEVTLSARYFHLQNALYQAGQTDDAASVYFLIRYSFL